MGAISAVKNWIVLASFVAAVMSAMPLAAANHEKWVETRSPNFIVVSNAGEAESRKVAVQFEQIRALFRQSLPYVAEHPSPVITILAVKDEASLSELLPEYWSVKGRAHPAGIFIDAANQFQVAVNVAAHGENPYQAIYHEYYHSVTTPYADLPAWVAEGMAEFFGNSQILGKDATSGRVNGDVIQELRAQPLIPLDVLFKVNHTSPYYNERQKVNIFYAESWALCHYLMLGDKGAHRAMFTAFLKALANGATEEDAAAKEFGDLKKLNDDLMRYISGFTFFELQMPAPPRLADTELHTRTVSDAEANAYRGGFLALHQQYKQAEPLLQEAARLDPKLELAQQNLALFYAAQEQWTEALAPLNAAIDLNPNNATTRFLRAELNFDRIGTARDSPQIEADLRQAIEANANFAPPYQLLALYLAANNRSLPEALTFAQKAVSLEQGNVYARFVVAQVLARMGRYDQAEAVVRAIRFNAADPSFKQRTDAFLEYVQKLRDYDARKIQQEGEAASVRSRAAAEQPRQVSSNGVTQERSVVKRSSAGRNAPQVDALMAQGPVAAVDCTGREMRVTITVAGVPVVLHTSDRTAVNYTSDVPNRPADIEPCSELSGHTVKVLSATDGDNEILSIHVEK